MNRRPAFSPSLYFPILMKGITCPNWHVWSPCFPRRVSNRVLLCSCLTTTWGQEGCSWLPQIPGTGEPKADTGSRPENHWFWFSLLFLILSYVFFFKMLLSLMAKQMRNKLTLGPLSPGGQIRFYICSYRNWCVQSPGVSHAGSQQ